MAKTSQVIQEFGPQMGKRVFVMVLGFTDVERHALNSVFRLSEGADVTYEAWTPESAEAPSLALVDGESDAGRRAMQTGLPPMMGMFWVGPKPPSSAIREFQRPLSWPEVVEGLDDLFGIALGFDLDDDYDFDAPDTVPSGLEPEAPRRRALMVSEPLESRLYLRAKLALHGMPLADEALSVAMARELIQGFHYALVTIDLDSLGDAGWVLLRELTRGQPGRVERVVGIKRDPGWLDRLRARWSGVGPLLDNPPDPNRFHALASFT